MLSETLYSELTRTIDYLISDCVHGSSDIGDYVQLHETCSSDELIMFSLEDD